MRDVIMNAIRPLLMEMYSWAEEGRELYLGSDQAIELCKNRPSHCQAVYVWGGDINPEGFWEG